MKRTIAIAFLLAQTLHLPAAAKPLSFGQLCQLIITDPSAVPKNQAYVVPKAFYGKPLFSGNVTTCVIYQMAAYNLHQQNWDYSKQAAQWYNHQSRSQRAAIANSLSKSSQYPDLKALVDLKYIEMKRNFFTGYYTAPGPGPAQ